MKKKKNFTNHIHVNLSCSCSAHVNIHIIWFESNIDGCIYNSAAHVLQMVGVQYDSSRVTQFQAKVCHEINNFKLNFGSQNTNSVD